MKFRLWIYVLLVAGLPYFFGCAVPPGTIPRSGQPSETPVGPITEESRPLDVSQVALFYRLNPEGDPKNILDVLNKNPKLRMTLIFPAHYFDSEERRGFVDKFRTLVSSDQIEIALTLENEPNLPLLGNIQLAEKTSGPLGVSFSYPDDISVQIARASGRYQKRWGKIPAGLYPPYLELSEHVLKSAQKFRLFWVLGKSNESWGAKYFGSTALLLPQSETKEEEFGKGTQEWAKTVADSIPQENIFYVNGDDYEDLEFEKYFFSYLSQQTKRLENRSFALGRELIIKEDWVQASSEIIFENDTTPWFKTPIQKAAWKALSDARRTVESFKNAGRPNLTRMDAAFEEIYSAESGDFLLSLGQDQVSLPNSERNFVATLANVYRLCGEDIPPSLNRLFSNKKWVQQQVKSTGSNKPFFVEGKKSFTWNDPWDDDSGAGMFKYPLGTYAKGSFDLREFTVSWNDSEVKIKAVFGDLPSEKNHQVLPLVDIYIDVNRLSGAGSVDPLKKRGGFAIASAAAWEYALALSQQTAILYQPLPGKDSRKIESYMPSVDLANNTIVLTVPLSTFRAKPSNWRLSVAVLGTEFTPHLSEHNPVPILAKSGTLNFGGAQSGRSVPRSVDILSPTVEDQKDRISSYQSGGKVVLPYVETP